MIVRFLVWAACLFTLPNCSLAQYPLPAGLPENHRLSSAKLDTLSRWLETSGSSALLILVDGKLVYEWGATQPKHTVHSIRKALINSLYGIYVGNGTIDTTQTLATLGIDDKFRLSDAEKQATVADILKSRSGVYHPAAAVSEGMLRDMPDRNSKAPGEHFYYNNWDFNVAGYILEKKTGKSIYELFYQHIGQPLGMDFGTNIQTLNGDEEGFFPDDDTDGFYQYERSKSNYPAYHFRLSARDMALYGQLYLQNGNWNGQQLIPESWIEASTTAYSITNPTYGIGYGMLWNVLMPTENRTAKSFYHTGAGVHMLGVYPASRLVLVHRVNTEQEYNFTEAQFYRMISLVWRAYTD
jgi:CubicO group peptidase (beta-lactamase class C family)